MDDRARIGDDDEPIFVGERLLRAIVLPDDTRLDGWKLQVVNLYDDGLEIRAWRGDGGDPDTEGLGWHIVDDVGTEYVTLGGSGSGGGERSLSECEIAPAVPASATKLTILGIREGRVEVPLV
ncbi:MAG: hypothetical protein QOG41_60 [Thermoleophilaceae bacterium]|nr:hypothetical protein [Thermoleophilaceae bacterium]